MTDEEKARTLEYIRRLQNIRDEAAEHAAKLTAEIERLLDIIDPKQRQIRFPAEG